MTDSMLVEVAGGWAESGSMWVEIDALELRDGVLRVRASLHRPVFLTADIGHPYAVVATRAYDGAVALDLFDVSYDIYAKPVGRTLRSDRS